MAIRNLLVLLDSNSRAIGSYATSFALTFDAHLTAAAVVVDPTTLIGLADAPTTFLALALEEARAAARRILEEFEATAHQAGLKIETEPLEAAVGTTGQALGPLARHFDLTIVEQPDPDFAGEREIMIEAVLFGSGRPVLVVPYAQTSSFRLENVLIAWDGSATAARALGDAMPILQRAKRVELLTVADESDDLQVSGNRIRRHLNHHGLNPDFQRLPRARDVAGVLLSRASDVRGDLMVMGGYGHSRFREFILGGATRGILESMTLPVLMSH